MIISIRLRAILFILTLFFWGCESSLDSFREQAENSGLSSSSINLHGLDAHLAAATVIYPSSSWLSGSVSRQSVGKDTVVYVVYVGAGLSYTFQWDDGYQGSGTYTADVSVTILDANGYEVMSRRDSGYNTSQTLIANSDCFYIIVDQYSTSSSVGSFAVKVDYTYGSTLSSSYGVSSPSAYPIGTSIYSGTTFMGSPVYEMNESQWVIGALSPLSSTFDTIVYRVPVVPGVTYRVQWDDSFSGSGTYTLDAYVAIYNEDQTSLLTWTDSGYSTIRSVTPTGPYIYVLVKNYYSGSSGTFAVLVTPY